MSPNFCVIFFVVLSVSGQDIEPKFQVVKVGEPIIIRCKSETVPQWYKFGVPVKNTYDSKLIIQSATEDDTGTYTCKGQITNNGTANYFNSKALVMVAVPDNSRIISRYISVDEYANAYFTCNSYGRPQWFFKDTTTFPIAYTNTLSLHYVEKDEEGNYYCFGDYEGDKKKYFIAEAVLQVNVQPHSIDQTENFSLEDIEYALISSQNVLPQFQIVKVGEPFHIRCNSETVPQWHKFGVTVVNTHKGQVSIPYATKDDSGIYTCSGQKTNNGTLEYFNSGAIVRVVSPDNNRINPRYKSVDKGAVATFTCNSHNRPTWFFKDTNTYPIAYTITLSLHYVDEDDEGKYLCVGDYEDDNKGYFIAEAELKINGFNIDFHSSTALVTSTAVAKVNSCLSHTTITIILVFYNNN